MREKLLARLADFIYAHHKSIVIAGVMITAFMGWCASRLELRLNFIELLNPNAPEVRRINYANSNFGGLSLLFVIVDADSPARARAFADVFAAALLKHPDYVNRVFYKIDPEIFLDRALLFLKPDELEKMAGFFEKNRAEVSETLADPHLSSLLARLNLSVEKQLSRGQFTAEDSKQIEETFGQLESVLKTATTIVEKGKTVNNGESSEIEKLRSDFIKRLIPEEYRGEVDLSNPYRTDPTGKHLFMLVRASKPTDDFEWNTEFMAVVEKVADSLAPAFPDVKVRMTGNMAIMRDEHRTIVRDMKVVSIISFVGVMALFAIGFRGFTPLAIVGLSLGMGMTWSYGITYLLIGYLNVITSVFCSIIMGMGIDYAILLITRYTEERDAGYDIKKALSLTMVQTGKGILTGAIATSGAFYAMGVGKFRAAQQMGLIAGNGIITYCTVMMVILPAIMVWRDIRTGQKAHADTREAWAMNKLAKVVRAGWASILIAGIMIVAFLGWRATKMQFEYDYTKIEAKGLPSMDLLQEMPKLFGWDINYAMVFSRSLDQDRDLARKLRIINSVSKVQALSDFIPANQDTNLAIISRIAKAINGIKSASPPIDAPISEEEYSKLKFELERLKSMLNDLETLASLADEEKAEKNITKLKNDLEVLIAAIKGPNGPRVRATLGYLQNRLATEISSMWERFGKMAAARELTLDDLPSYIKDHFVGVDGVYCIYAFPRSTIWNEYFMEQHVYELKSVSLEASGISVIFYSILNQVKSDYMMIGAASFLVVFFVLLAGYRNAYWSALTLVPLAVGAIMMMGMMNVLGIKLNFVNMGVVPLIIGIGIDYGVYMVHRWLFEGGNPDNIDVIVRSTGKGVQYSALTTIVGFGSLSFASYRGLQSMGEILSMGILFCLIGAVIGLPAIYHFLAWLRRESK